MTRRKSVADRQRAAQRLLFAVAEDTYDGELDVDWDRPAEPGTAWMPDSLISVYGTRLWKSLTPRQRTELGKRELVALLATAMCLQTAASMLTFRTIAIEQALVDDRSRFLLSMINDRSRNVTMFGRLIKHAGVAPDIERLRADRLAHTVLLTPAGPMTQVLSLLADEFVDAVSREVSEQDELQPHVLQVLKVHSGARDRHIAFAWDELEDALGRTGRLWSRLQGIFAAVRIVRVGPGLISSEIYRSVGLNPYRAVWAAYTSRNYRARVNCLTGELVAFGLESGLFNGRTARAVLRLGRCLPPARDETADRG
ncbi:diiron oxygenase [Nocardia sp. BSTN01]|uniref:diiron oxygenase n=1 Tax=Nocardia sp. BSTN01 TaxID=2783665 RepID=UPI00188F1C6B|nr:diiron oxygenase [Nocardia sp. BSTN01]MBF5000513.1 diiron oxygenase [Nocardia sp. BSTN01]